MNKTDITNIFGWHTDRTILAEYPAYQIIEPPEQQTFIGSESPYRSFSAGTEVMVKWDSYNGKEMWRRFSFGSVVSSALSSNNSYDPIASYEDSVAKGEETHWLYPCATVLTWRSATQSTSKEETSSW